MSRKFNAGRQSDLLLNEKLHNLYTYLEFIPFGKDEANPISMPKQTRQTKIPEGALWLQHPINERTNKLRVHTMPEATSEDERWPCLFEGYYHPASIKSRTAPAKPVHGQLWINEKNMLMVYDEETSTGSWVQVAAKQADEVNYNVFNGLDFQMIDPLLPKNKIDENGNKIPTNEYSVPYEYYGKFFAAEDHDEEFIYCHPDKDPKIPPFPTYELQTDEGTISVIGESANCKAKAWISINPLNLNKITKRLIKINKPKTYYKLASKDNDGNFITEEEGKIILKVVGDDRKVNEYDKETEVKVSIANKFKTNEAMTFKVDEYVEAYEYTDQYTYFINVPAGRTEFYAFKSSEARKSDGNNNKIGRLLKHYSLKEGLRDEATLHYELYNEELHGTDVIILTVVKEVQDKDSEISLNNVENLGFKENDKLVYVVNKEILDYRNDYEIQNGGILLDKNIGETYDYIYAITYDFRQEHTIDGNLIRKTQLKLDAPDQMYIGEVSGIPVVFMDGLYLEAEKDTWITDKDGETRLKSVAVYKYDKSHIIFSDNDILDEMQILVVSFPRVNTYIDGYGEEHRKEYIIDSSKIKERLEYTVCSEEKDAKQVVENPIDPNKQIAYNELMLNHPYLEGQIDASGNYYVKDTQFRDAIIECGIADSMWSFYDSEHPEEILVFYNGLAGYTFVANEVDIDEKYHTITIKDFGEIYDNNGRSTVFVVHTGKGNYRSYGVLEDGVLYDPNVKANKDYLIIVDGIVMSPYNEDITIEEVEQLNEDGTTQMVGKITITDATVALDSEYTLVELVNFDSDLTGKQNEEGVMVVYDDMFTPYTIPIVNGNSQNSVSDYNDCDSAVVMSGPGALVDRESILKDFDPSDVFVGGQIVKVREQTAKEELYEYRLYSFSSEYTVLDPIEDYAIIADCENMITYHVNQGTVMLNPVGFEQLPVTVYAYTYIDSVDEKLMTGRRLSAIEVPGHANTGTSIFKTNRNHLYDLGVNSLSTYLNGIMIPHVEPVSNDIRTDTFHINKQFSSMFIPFTNRYEEAEMDYRFKGQDMYNVLKVINKDSRLDSRIEVINEYGETDACLVQKFFNSEHQLEQAKALKEYIENNMRNNRLCYLIENVENNERMSSRRHWNAPRYDNGNMPNTYTTSMRLIPGILNVYVNGVLLHKDDYAVFDNNKIMIGFDLVGGQEILPANKGDYNHPYRIITNEGFKYIECEGDDEILIEVRDDMTIKKRSYEIKDISYETYTFDILDYEYPKSLSVTKDLIKIYINGVLYDGKYTNINGVITLLECDLEEDPLYKQLRMHPSMMEEYERQYGEYVKHTDIITFEWR